MSDSHLRALLDEIGLEREMKWVETKTGFYSGGKLYSMSTSLEFLRFPPLNMWERMRLGGDDLLRLEDSQLEAARKDAGGRLARNAGRDAARSRRSGCRYCGQSSARPIARLRPRSSGLTRSGCTRLAAAARRKKCSATCPAATPAFSIAWPKCWKPKGVEIRCGAARREGRSASSGAGVTVQFKDGSEQVFDQVVFTTPSPIIANVCPQLTADEQTSLPRHRVPRHRLLVAAAEEAAVEVLRHQHHRRLGAAHGRDRDDDDRRPGRARRPRARLPAEVHDVGRARLRGDGRRDPRALPRRRSRRCIPSFSRDDVRGVPHVARRYVMALPTLGYSERLPPMKTSVPGVYAVNSAHILKGNLNVNETIQDRRRCRATACWPRRSPNRKSHGTSSICHPQRPTMTKPIASLSLDLDNKWCYLRTHGVAGWDKYPSYLDTVVPRVLDVCAARDLRLTCFVVGRDAAIDENGDALGGTGDRRSRDGEPLVQPRAVAPHVAAQPPRIRKSARPRR